MRHFVRYTFVGGIATAAHYLVLVLCVEKAGWPAYVASGFGAVIGAQVAYVGNRWFTFAHRGDVLSSWPRFQATALLGAALGMLIVALCVRAGVYYLIGQMIATLAGLAMTFAINRAWTFRPLAPGASPTSTPLPPATTVRQDL